MNSTNSPAVAGPVERPVRPAVAEALRMAHAYADAKLARYGLLGIKDPPDPAVAFAALEASIEIALAAESERCAAILKARADKIAAEAERAVKSAPDEVSALRAMAWQLTVAEREIRGPNGANEGL